MELAFLKPVPKAELADLYELKLRQYRSFSAAIMWLGAFLAFALWAWDFAIDADNGHKTLIYRIALIPILGGFGLYLQFGLSARFRTLAFVVSMIASQFCLYLILDQLDRGYEYGIGAHLFWLMFVPLVAVGLTLKDAVYALLALAVMPVVWYATGVVPQMPIYIVIAYMWPATGVVMIALVINNNIALHMFREQRLLERAHEETKKLARTDPLTGLNNRRSLLSLGNVRFQNAKRYQHPLTVLAVDLDNFKSVNDIYGHAVGDDVLRAVADVLQSSARTSDIVARLGGEEFVAVLGETDLEHGCALAERVRKRIEDTKVAAVNVDISVTASIGVAEISRNNLSLEALIDQADVAMYAAKSAGKNRVQAAVPMGT